MGKRRAGRKRKLDVDRFPGGQIKRMNEVETPARMTADIVPELSNQGKRGETVSRYRRVGSDQLDDLLVRKLIDQSHVDAGREFFRLWNARRVMYMDAPHLTAKLASIYRQDGGGRLLKLDNDELANSFNRQYRKAVEHISSHKLPQCCPMVRSVRALCLTGDMPESWIFAAKQGLGKLADFFGIENKK